HPRTMRGTLAKLAVNRNPDVRCAVGENANTAKDVLWLLARDEDADVRFSLAENHNINDDILIFLSSDENPYVAARAQRTLQRVSSTNVAYLAISQERALAMA